MPQRSGGVTVARRFFMWMALEGAEQKNKPKESNGKEQTYLSQERGVDVREALRCRGGDSLGVARFALPAPGFSMSFAA